MLASYSLIEDMTRPHQYTSPMVSQTEIILNEDETMRVRFILNCKKMDSCYTLFLHKLMSDHIFRGSFEFSSLARKDIYNYIALIAYYECQLTSTVSLVLIEFISGE